MIDVLKASIFILLVIYSSIGFWLLSVECISKIALRHRTVETVYRVISLVGVPVHELSHAIVALVFNHRVTKVSLVSFDSRSASLGSVNHQRDRLSMYQNFGMFFIGFAPIVGSAISVYMLAYLISDNAKSLIEIILFNSNASPLYERLDVLIAWVSSVRLDCYFCLWFFVSMQICYFGVPSRADFKNSLIGVPYLLAAIAIVVLALYTIGIDATVVVWTSAISILKIIFVVSSFSFVNVAFLLCIAAICILIDVVKRNLTNTWD
ncbi:hypothetical protein [Vibrio furnissii]|uniref:hypothetical protein n=1 Tax=Vibrio furnissii TaxID=29494 RepID=UPI001EEC8609|nr:hypothetical protein [Vibrio furnissii]